MKSVVCTKLGDPKLLEIKEVDIPNPHDDEVLIKVDELSRCSFSPRKISGSC